MTEFSDYLEDALINGILRNIQYTTPGTVIYVALYTSDPTDADVGTEVTGGSYVRVQVTAWNDPAGGGATANTSEIAFVEATADWGIVTHIGIHDHATAGNLLFHTILDASRTVNTGDTFKIAAGDLDVVLA